MSKEKVTVVMPVYNREKYVGKAIASVLKQTLKEWKMLIIDDASTDRTPNMIKIYRSNKIRHVRLPKNQGTGKALQHALKMIDTPYFVIVDSDDWLEPQALEILLKEMEKQPKKTSLIYGNTVYWKDVDGKAVKTCVEKHRSFTDKYEYIMYGPMVYPRFLRTETVRKVKGFETDDPYHGRFDEDRYLLLKLIAVSHFHWIDANLYNCRSHNDNATQPKNRKYYSEVKRFIFSKMLKEWGNEYEPVFAVSSDGWLYIKELKKRKP